jgi:hypothetical protein
MLSGNYKPYLRRSYLSDSSIKGLQVNQSNLFVNSFPLLSSGDGAAHLTLQSLATWVTVSHYSGDPVNSTVYAYETGKNVYWGVSSDGGNYIFRGRNLLVQEGVLGIGSLRGVFDVGKDGPIFLSSSPNGGSSQTVYLSGHVYLAPYSTGNVSYLQARRQNDAGSTELQLRTLNNGSITEAIRINSVGNVGIGTTDPQGYRLAVNGNAIFAKVKVKDPANWPDYVFQKNYLLRPLSEIEQFIQQYLHLPDVPAAAEVEKNGLDLGDNQSVLLKKIEELTLYLIEQDKKLERLEREMDEFKKGKHP